MSESNSMKSYKGEKSKMPFLQVIQYRLTQSIVAFPVFVHTRESMTLYELETVTYH